MSILRRYLQQVVPFDEGNFVQFENQLARGMITTKTIHPRFTVRTQCLDCDEWCLALRLTSGERILLVVVADRYVLHQCPVANEAEEQFDMWPMQGDRRHD